MSEKTNTNTSEPLKTENIASSKEIVENSLPSANINQNPVAIQAEKELRELTENTANLDYNDMILELKNIANLCNQKVMEYSDISATFKQIGQLLNNFALNVSVDLAKKNQLDTSRFKLVK